MEKYPIGGTVYGPRTITAEQLMELVCEQLSADGYSEKDVKAFGEKVAARISAL